MIPPKPDITNMAFFALATVAFCILLFISDARAQDVEMCEVRDDGSILCCQIMPDDTELCTSSIRSSNVVWLPIVSR